MAATVKSMRYARAAFEIAMEQNKPDEWRQDLEKVANVAADPDVFAFLESPKIALAKKAGLLKGQLKDVEPMVFNLLYVLVEKGNAGITGEVAAEYSRLLDSQRGIEQAEVTTAAPLSQAELDTLQKQLSKIIGKDIVMNARVDPSLIGGMVARVGDKIIDGSAKGRLAVLRREIRRGGA
jgi:F-type H+-transporting ATPase subunit delta